MRAIRKVGVAGVLVLLLLLVGGEVFARYLGLGTPPLSVVHPTIEYMFAPNQDVVRFGKRITVNRWGMRSDPFPSSKGGEEFRVMVFGDSVTNGGALTDQSDLATTLIKQRLTSSTNKPVIVGNISAGSWGPGNWRAYAKAYGFFDADTVVLVISSHDVADNPSFEPLDKDHPTSAPVLALWEAATRYLPRYLPAWPAAKEPEAKAPTDEEVHKGLDDLEAFLAAAKEQAQSVIVLQHLEREELLSRSPKRGFALIRDLCTRMGIRLVSLEPYFRKALDAGVEPYRDTIHPNAAGQVLIANAIMDALNGANAGKE